MEKERPLDLEFALQDRISLLHCPGVRGGCVLQASGRAGAFQGAGVHTGRELFTWLWEPLWVTGWGQ